MAQKLTPEEDATLRRLHWFERFGAELSPSMRVIKSAIRSRDKRTSIREPEDRGVRQSEGFTGSL